MVRCTIYAQISGPWGKDTIILLPPQWGSNSKVSSLLEKLLKEEFQSPQWGSNSKAAKGSYETVPLEVSVPAMGK